MKARGVQVVPAMPARPPPGSPEAEIQARWWLGTFWVGWVGREIFLRIGDGAAASRESLGTPGPTAGEGGRREAWRGDGEKLGPIPKFSRGGPSQAKRAPAAARRQPTPPPARADSQRPPSVAPPPLQGPPPPQARDRRHSRERAAGSQAPRAGAAPYLHLSGKYPPAGVRPKSSPPGKAPPAAATSQRPQEQPELGDEGRGSDDYLDAASLEEMFAAQEQLVRALKRRAEEALGADKDPSEAKRREVEEAAGLMERAHRLLQQAAAAGTPSADAAEVKEEAATKPAQEAQADHREKGGG